MQNLYRRTKITTIKSNYKISQEVSVSHHFLMCIAYKIETICKSWIDDTHMHFCLLRIFLLATIMKMPYKVRFEKNTIRRSLQQRQKTYGFPRHWVCTRIKTVTWGTLNDFYRIFRKEQKSQYIHVYVYVVICGDLMSRLKIPTMVGEFGEIIWIDSNMFRLVFLCKYYC